jgi:hypothetical protein
MANSSEWNDTPALCYAPVAHILTPVQCFLYRANDIEGVDRAALQRDILDVIAKEGETGAWCPANLACNGITPPDAVHSST